MKKEIGSIFPLDSKNLSLAESENNSFSTDRIYYSLCREALFDIASSLYETNCQVLIPAYTCQTVITPFEEAGWKCHYFSINKNLRIDIIHLVKLVQQIHPTVLIVHPYFGMDLGIEEQSVLQQIHNQGIKIIVDLTQCLFSSQELPFADYIVASYRKWMSFPDGGFLIQKDKSQPIKQPDIENSSFAYLEKAAMYLRGQYFSNGEQRTKEISIHLSKEADHLAEDNIKPHKMSQTSYNLFLKENFECVQQKRIDNFKFLFTYIQNNDKVTIVCTSLKELTTAPLYFPIFVENREELQRNLAIEAIYAPIIWTIKDPHLLINDEVKYIYDHILAIPCDQRYDRDDMLRIINVINNY